MTDSSPSPSTDQLGHQSGDQQLAPKDVTDRLHAEFGEHVGRDDIERSLRSYCERFNGRAIDAKSLTARAERWTRQRLAARVRVSGQLVDTRPTVLFLCTHNAGRSQMALGFFNHLAGDQAVAWSGGSEPGDQINPSAVQAMAEVGVDITREFPKPWSDEIVQAADVVVKMGCGDTCPCFPASVTRIGNSRIPPGKGSKPCVPSAMKSKSVFADCCPN